MKNFNIKELFDSFDIRKLAQSPKFPVIMAWSLSFVALLVFGFVLFGIFALSYQARFANPEAKAPAPVLVNLEAYEKATSRLAPEKLKSSEFNFLTDPFGVPEVQPVTN